MLSKFESWISANRKLIIVIIIFLLGVYFLIPNVLNYALTDNFEKLLHDNLGLSRSWAKFLSIPLSFVQAALMPATLSWFLWGRRKALSFVAVMGVFGTAPLLHAILDTNFNQRTGNAQKYFVRGPGGGIVLSDADGVDPNTGTTRQPLTPQIAQIIEREKRGIKPHRVTNDPRTLTYFDATSGRPLIWFTATQSGQYHLFDAEGFDPDDGNLVQPVSPQIVIEIVKRANSVEQEAHLEQQRYAEAIEQERVKKARSALRDALGVSMFPASSLVLGAKPIRPEDPASVELARIMLDCLNDQLRVRRVLTTELPATAYGSSTYSVITEGRIDALADTGLLDTGRTVFAMLVEADCRDAHSVAGLVSCSGRAVVHWAYGSPSSFRRQTWIERGAGVDRRDALTQTAEFLVQRHLGDILNQR